MSGQSSEVYERIIPFKRERTTREWEDCECSMCTYSFGFAGRKTEYAYVFEMGGSGENGITLCEECFKSLRMER